MENTSFLIARRRNEQRRNGAAWIDRLCRATGFTHDGIRLVDAEESIVRERQRKDLLRVGLRDGILTRLSGLSFPDAWAIWRECLTASADEIVECSFLRYPDFAFWVSSSRLAEPLESLLEFDGDTVTAASLDLAKGVAVDIYPEGSVNKFELDRWGHWR